MQGVTGNGHHPELYTLDVSPYESLHVAYYTILRGKGVLLAGKDHHPEYDAIYLGFSVRFAVRSWLPLLLAHKLPTLSS